MLKSYFKIAFRNLWKNKLNSILNITGLSLGIACSLLMLFHVKEELSWDKQFSKSDRIYRLTNEGLGEGDRHWAVVSPLHGLEIRDHIPEIDLTTRFYYMYTNILAYTPIDSPPVRFEEQGGFYSDPASIEMFDIEFLKGDPSKALTEVNTIILTESLANKYFGDLDPIGSSIRNESDGLDYRITGVIADIDFNTHLKFDFLVSMETFYQRMIARNASEWLEARGWAHFFTYVLINPNQTMEGVMAKMPDFTTAFYSSFGSREEVLAQTKLHLQPLTDIHLRSNLEQEMGPNSDIAYVYIFSAIALFLLVIAGVNFVNISTAQAFKRMKEIGVRKVMGAQKIQIIRQFLGESLLLTLVAAVFALILFQLVLPFYNNLAGKEMDFFQLFTAPNLALLLSMIVGLSFAAGLYPALFMSGFRPASSFRSGHGPRSSTTLTRKGLVVFQFVISIFMIFSTITIYRQMQFFHNKDLGFNKENMLAVKLYGGLAQQAQADTQTIKAELMGYSPISQVAMASNLPGERLSVENLRPEGIAEDVNLPSVRYLRVDEDFIETMNIRLKEGRSFQGLTRNSSAFILNEKAVNMLNLEDPVGKFATNFRGVRGEIIGVVEDFNWASLHNEVEPVILDYRPNWAGYLLIRFQGERIPDLLKLLESKFGEMAPANLFLFTFVDDEWNRLYLSESRMSDLFKAFSLLAIFISCLGLFGLSAYAAELRTKEIGVRKVLGATFTQVLSLLSKDFVRWVLAANLVAWPLAYYAMYRWLQNFAYRIQISLMTFIFAAALALLVALATVCFHAGRAAMSDPVDSLRYE